MLSHVNGRALSEMQIYLDYFCLFKRSRKRHFAYNYSDSPPIMGIDLSIIPGSIFKAPEVKYCTRSPLFQFCYHVTLINLIFTYDPRYIKSLIKIVLYLLH